MWHIIWKSAKLNSVLKKRYTCIKIHKRCTYCINNIRSNEIDNIIKQNAWSYIDDRCQYIFHFLKDVTI